MAAMIPVGIEINIENEKLRPSIKEVFNKAGQMTSSTGFAWRREKPKSPEIAETSQFQ